MMSQIGSGPTASGPSCGSVRFLAVKFTSAILTYFGLIVTQRDESTKGSYPKRPWAPSFAFCGSQAPYRDLAREAKARYLRKTQPGPIFKAAGDGGCHGCAVLRPH